MKKPFIIALNIGYWVMYLLLLSMFMLFLEAGVKTISQRQEVITGFIKVMSMITILPGLLSFYTFYHYIFSRFLTRKKIWAVCLYGLATALLSGVIGFIGLNIIMGQNIFGHNNIKQVMIIVIFMSSLCLVHGIIALVMKGFISWYGDIKVKEELQQKNFETELALVKSQLNPHFLFNTINNIDVLIEKDASKASAYLNKLSDIMRFMLYETKTDHIPLEKELAYISKYIDLQKIRNANTGFVQYHIEGDPGGLKIASMLFIPFIENAFKHSADKKKESAIVINIVIAGKNISLYCMNHCNENPLSRQEAGGLGNELIRKRLELLYPGKHELAIVNNSKTYTVTLGIDTAV